MFAETAYVANANTTIAENECVPLVEGFEFCAPDQDWQVSPLPGLVDGFGIKNVSSLVDVEVLIAFTCDAELEHLNSDAQEQEVKAKLLKMSYGDASDERRSFRLFRGNPAVSFLAEENSGLAEQTVVYVHGCFQLALTRQSRTSTNTEAVFDRTLHQRVVDAIRSEQEEE